MNEQEKQFIIDTPRVRMVVADAEVAPKMVSYLLRNREHFASTFPPVSREYYTESFWRNRLQSGRNEFRQGKSLPLVLFHKGDPDGLVIGDITFSNIVRGPFQACYLGYKLDSANVGKGFMFEALQAAINYVFTQMKLHRIMANYTPENVRSGRLLRKLGFTPEGYARDYLFVGGAWRDHILTSLINPGPVIPD